MLVFFLSASRLTRSIASPARLEGTFPADMDLLALEDAHAVNLFLISTDPEMHGTEGKAFSLIRPPSDTHPHTPECVLAQARLRR